MTTSMADSDWDFYKCNINDRLSSVYLDLALVNKAPIATLPRLNWHWIRLRYADDRGLSTDEEFDALRAYEDELDAAIAGNPNIMFVGRITGAGRREFYFYSSLDADVEACFETVISNHPEYQFQRGSKRDADWRHYLGTLYPGKYGLEQIRERRGE